MNLEKRTEGQDVVLNDKGRDYLPFGVQYLESPEPIGYTNKDTLGYTSVTFSTFMKIPLIDDGD